MPLSEQDRGRWNRALVAEGQQIVRECLRRGRPGPYQIQGAINAVHSVAATSADTDWGQIFQLYDHLLDLVPGPVVALHRAVALAEVHGPAAALATVDELHLDDYHVFHAVRADLLRRWDGLPRRLPRTPEPPTAPVTPPSERSSSLVATACATDGYRVEALRHAEKNSAR